MARKSDEQILREARARRRGEQAQRIRRNEQHLAVMSCAFAVLVVVLVVVGIISWIVNAVAH
jgi:hypothetical protein